MHAYFDFYFTTFKILAGLDGLKVGLHRKKNWGGFLFFNVKVLLSP